MDKLSRAFIRYQPMVRAIAYRLSANRGVSESDLIDEGDYALAMLFCKFDSNGKRHRNPTDVSDNTWVYRVVRWSMLDYIRRVRKDALRLQQLMSRPPKKPRYHWMDEFLSGASNDAITVLYLVIYAPSELVGALRVTRRLSSRKRAKAAISRYLLQRMGWAADRVDATFAEIQECLSALN